MIFAFSKFQIMLKQNRGRCSVCRLFKGGQAHRERLSKEGSRIYFIPKANHQPGQELLCGVQNCCYSTTQFKDLSKHHISEHPLEPSPFERHQGFYILSKAGVPTYLCRKCGSPFPCQLILNNHQRRCLGKNMLRCHSCDFVFRNLVQYRRHLAERHSDLPQNYVVASQTQHKTTMERYFSKTLTSPVEAFNERFIEDTSNAIKNYLSKEVRLDL